MMKMNLREIFLTFSGLSFYLVLFSLTQVVYSEETIYVGQMCVNSNGTVNLQEGDSATLIYDKHSPMDCDILLVDRPWQYVVITFYEWDIKGNEKLVFKDGYTELSLTGRNQIYGDKTFIFKGPTTIHFSTNETHYLKSTNKFKFLFTVINNEYPGCEKDDFVCNNKMCLNDHNLVCNNENNCGDGSDETDCKRLCALDEFECGNRKCISKSKFCNGRNDCGDMSDEKSCNRYCRLDSEYKCNNTICIWKYKVCDGKNDCGDWSDETNCHRECNSRQFPCKNRKCIDDWKVCNGKDDCGDRSDEKNCGICTSSEFSCNNGLCIPNKLVCDNRNDCGDSSDEQDCNVAGGNILDQKKKSVNPYYVAIAVCAVLLAIIVITFISTLIRNRISDKKKKTANQLPNISSNFRHVQPLDRTERIRQSFRLGRQTASSSTKPPGEIQNTTVVSEPQVPSMHRQLQSSVDSTDVHHVLPPSLLERVRQSFRSGRQFTQSSIQPSNHIYSAPITSGEQTYQVPSMYPNLQSGFDNPEFKAEE